MNEQERLVLMRMAAKLYDYRVAKGYMHLADNILRRYRDLQRVTYGREHVTN